MTFVIPKLFHKILVKRLESYLLQNGIVNPSIQKEFLMGINGTAEHIFTATAFIENVIQHSSPLTVTFLDLQNAFGSVAHTLITDILIHIKLPDNVILYISDGYSKLTAFVKIKDWTTPTFEIKRGMFQGNTLSLIIFLAVFNPLIELSSQITTSDFFLKMSVPNSVGLPPINSAIYVHWNENSDEPIGWYYATVKSHFPDGTTNIEYANSDTEIVTLHSVKWEPTRKGQKPYLSNNRTPPKFPLKRLERKF